MNSKARILKLGEARVWRTYLGGSVLDSWHNRKSGEIGNFPEDWIASTVSATNPCRENIVEGLSKVVNLPEQPLLKDIFTEQAVEYFGKEHFEAIGATAGTLIKLIDSSERLTIQVHPDKKFAREKFNSDYGKTESWYILDTQEIDGQPACIYFGFKPEVTREIWQDVFDRQDIPAMLDCLHKIEVQPGDSFFIPGGLPHAIGAGCLLAEVQEPTDYTLRTEKVTPSGLTIHDIQIHQGLGFETMMDCFHYDKMTVEQVKELYQTKPVEIYSSGDGAIVSIIDERHTDLFQMDRIRVKDNFVLPYDGRMKVWIVTKGSGQVITSDESVTMEKGDYLLIPAKTPDIRIVSQGNLEIIQCLPKKYI